MTDPVPSRSQQSGMLEGERQPASNLPHRSRRGARRSRGDGSGARGVRRPSAGAKVSIVPFIGSAGDGHAILARKEAYHGSQGMGGDTTTLLGLPTILI